MRTAPEPVQGPQRNDPWGGDAERFGLRNRLLGRQSWKSCLQGGTAGRRPGKGCSSSRGWPAPSGEDLLAGRNAEGPRLVVLPASLWTSCPSFLGRATSVDSITQAHALRPLGGATRAPAEKGAGGEKPLCLLSTPLCLTVSPSLWPDNPGRLLGTLSPPHTRGGHGVSLSSVLDYSPFLAGYLNPAYASENSPEMKPSTVHPLGMPPAS